MRHGKMSEALVMKIIQINRLEKRMMTLEECQEKSDIYLKLNRILEDDCSPVLKFDLSYNVLVFYYVYKINKAGSI